jgi:L-type amino acid transporter 9
MVTVVYLLVNLAYLCVLNLEEIDSLTGEAIAVPFAQKVIGKAGLIIIPILVSVSTFGSANGSIFVASRMIFAASRSSCLPSMLGGLHVKFGTPIPAIILTVILSSLYASIGSISGLIDSFSAAIWVYYALTFTSLLIMRVTYRKEERPFKVFFVIPLVMVFVSLAVVIFPLKDQLWESIGSFGGILLSVPVYFLFIYIGPFPKCLSFYVTFKSKLAKLNAYTADAVNRLLNCAPPAVQPDGLDDVQPKDSSSTT